MSSEVRLTDKAYNITPEDITYAKNALVQLLIDNGYDGTLEDGSAVYDLLIKPNALIYALINKDIARAKAYLSLEAAAAIKDELGDEYDTIVDAILSNWFIQRRDGKSSRGVVRCYFSKPLDVIKINKENTYFLINNEKYIPQADSIYTQGDFVKRDTGTVLSTNVYLDISVESVEPTDTVITPGAQVVGYINSMYFLNAEIINEFVHGEEKENSETFIKRAYDVITTRELITYKAINTVLINEFDSLLEVYTAGYGDTEQIRDIRTFDRITMHVGNHADIYCKTPIYATSVTLPVDENSLVELVEDGSNLFVIDVLGVSVKVEDEEGNKVTKQLEYYVNYLNEGLWGSTRNKVVLYINTEGVSFLDKPEVEVSYITSNFIPEIQRFVANDDQRVVCYDPLVKSKFPVIISLDLTFEKNEGFNISDDALKERVKDLVTMFTIAIEAYGTYSVSDLIYYIKANAPEVGLIDTPIQINYKMRQLVDNPIISNRTGMFSNITGFFTNTFTLPGGLSNQFTDNTFLFWTDPSLINVNIK